MRPQTKQIASTSTWQEILTEFFKLKSSSPNNTFELYLNRSKPTPQSNTDILPLEPLTGRYEQFLRLFKKEHAELLPALEAACRESTGFFSETIFNDFYRNAKTMHTKSEDEAARMQHIAFRLKKKLLPTHRRMFGAPSALWPNTSTVSDQNNQSKIQSVEPTP